MWPRSASRPSETSIALRARPRSRTPRSTRGSGVCSRVRQASSAASSSFTRPFKWASASAASPVAPESQISSPAHAASRLSARSAGTSPITGTEIARGLRVVPPPMSSVFQRSASRKNPCANAAIHLSSASGSASASVAQRGPAPIAAGSDRFTASSLCPSSPGSASGKKWIPAVSMSVETASSIPGSGERSAQSSPTPRTAVGASRVKYLRMMSNSEATSSGFSLLRAQLRDELVEHAVHVLVAVGAAEILRELDRFVDHHLVGYIGRVLELERREQQDAALNRRELLQLAIEERRDQTLERRGVRYRALQETREILGVGLAETFRFGELGLKAGRVVARELPRVQALQRELARTAPRRFHLWLFAMLLPRFAISTATSAQSRPFCAARAFACSSVSVVRIPFATGTPLSSCTCMSPDADSFATVSK